MSKKLFLLFMVFFAFTILFTGCDKKDDDNKKDDDLADYFPLAMNNQWVFQRSVKNLYTDAVIRIDTIRQTIVSDTT
jgi:hypothetical protein